MTSPNAQDLALLDRLQSGIESVLHPLVPPGSRVAMVDFPNHANVGDSAIWLGELEFVRRRKLVRTYSCDKETYRAAHLVKLLGSDGLILLHGGGNLGDLWTDHQELREKVIRDFPNYPIIQFSQTIYFRQQASLDRARETFDAHPRLTLLCRDQPSLDFARKHFAATSLLCPDMAFYLRQALRPRQPQCDVLWLARTDEESRGAAMPPIPPGVEVCDWLDESPTPLCEKNWALAARFWHEPGRWPELTSMLMESFDELADERMRRGCQLLSRGRAVVTDRLHGHILCLLLGIPHVMFDNSYGKLSGFRKTWTNDSTLARWASSPAEALELARTLI